MGMVPCLVREYHHRYYTIPTPYNIYGTTRGLCSRITTDLVDFCSLLYIAGLCCQWLKSDSVSTGVLRPGELLLLRVLYTSLEKLFLVVINFVSACRYCTWCL